MVMAPPHKLSAAFLCGERRVKGQVNKTTNQRKRNGLKNKYLLKGGTNGFTLIMFV